jgi:hypothetical protein
MKDEREGEEEEGETTKGKRGLKDKGEGKTERTFFPVQVRVGV